MNAIHLILLVSIWMVILGSPSAVFSAEEELATGKEILKLQNSVQEKRQQSDLLKKKAHEELDNQNYEQAVSKHRDSILLEEEAAKIEAELDKRIDSAIADLIKELSDAEFANRKAASMVLIKLGPRILPQLQKILTEQELDPETRLQLNGVLATAGDVEIDDKGRFRQWAKEASASTQYSDTSWSASQATGKPDTATAGDIETAWAPSIANGGEEWLELTYFHAVYPSVIRIHETYCPGAVIKVEVRDPEGELQVLWEGKDPTDKAPTFFEVEIPEEKVGKFRTKEVRITLDTKKVTGFNEIDAVELIGRSDRP